MPLFCHDSSTKPLPGEPVQKKEVDKVGSQGRVMALSRFKIKQSGEQSDMAAEPSSVGTSGHYRTNLVHRDHMSAEGRLPQWFTPVGRPRVPGCPAASHPSPVDWAAWQLALGDLR